MKLELTIYLSIMAICLISQTGFDFAKSNGYINNFTLDDYRNTAYINLLFGIWTLSLIARRN